MTAGALFWPFGDAAPQHGVRLGRTLGLVPSESVIVRRMKLPTAHGHEREQLIRFALEDEVAVDVASLEIASTPLGDQLLVLAAPRADCVRWFSWYRAQDGVVAALVPDYFSLPQPGAGWRLALNDGRALVRCDRYLGFATDADALPDLAAAMWRQLEGEHRRFEVQGEELPESLRQRLERDGWELVGMPWAADSVAPPAGLAGLSPPDKAGRLRPLPLWIAAAALLLVAAGVELFGDWREMDRLEAAIADNRTRAEQLFRQAFPQVGRIVDLEAQAQQELVQLRTAKATLADGFLPLYAALLSVLPDQGVHTTAISFVAGRLTVTADVTDASALDEMAQGLATQGLVLEHSRAGQFITLNVTRGTP